MNKFVNIFSVMAAGVVVVGCSTSDPYRDAPESQIYAITEIEEIEPASRVTIIKQASATEETEETVTSTTVRQSEAVTEEYEEEVEEIEISHSSEEKEIVQEAAAVQAQAVVVDDTFDCENPQSSDCGDKMSANYMGSSSTQVSQYQYMDTGYGQQYQIQQQASGVIVEETPIEEVVEQRTVITKTASSSFVNGYYSLGKDCNVRLQPGEYGQVANVAKKGRTLWVEDFSPNWAQVNRRAGAAYINKTCLSVE